MKITQLILALYKWNKLLLLLLLLSLLLLLLLSFYSTLPTFEKNS